MKGIGQLGIRISCPTVIILFLVEVLLLTACNLKPDANLGEVATAADGTKLELKILSSSDNTLIRSLKTYDTAVIQITLAAPQKTDSENALVTLSTTLGQIVPKNGTALTNNSGIATAQLLAQGVGGAGILSASVKTSSATLTVNYNFLIVDNQTQSGGTDDGTGTDNLSGSDAPPGSDSTGSGSTTTGTTAPTDVVIGTIKFVDANPSTLAIHGTGGQELSETSVVTFAIVDEDNKPVTNQLVTFDLNTSVGGLKIFPTTRYTDSRGLVSTFVYSGTVATSVRVTATTNATASDGNTYSISSQSDKLVVSSGLPDQNSFGLGLSAFNPEAADFVGKTVTVTATLADQFNNTVPNGTTVYFSSEGGSIDPFCFTKDGTCTVNWYSGNPLPSNHRINILATAIGNESFIDTDADGLYTNTDGEPYNDSNGNGVLDEPFTDTNSNSKFDEPFTDKNSNGLFDADESFTDYNHNGKYDGNGDNPAGETTYTDINGSGSYDGSGKIAAGESYTDVNGNGKFDGPGFNDLGEPYIDANENGKYDAGEYFIDSVSNGLFDKTGDGKYTGTVCKTGSNCSSARTVYVRTQQTLIASSSHAYATLTNSTGSVVYVSNYVKTSGTTPSIRDNSVTFHLIVTDLAGQVMPKGTVIYVQEDVSGNVSAAYASSFTVPNVTEKDVSFVTTGASEFDVTLADVLRGTNGQRAMMVRVVSPSGEETKLTFRMDD